MHTQLNALTPLKFISCGSNFDLVFYKAFLSYYLKFFTNKTDKLKKGPSSTFKSKKITIVDDITRKLAEIGSKTAIDLDFLQLMDGFCIVVGSFEILDNTPRVRLQINKQFQSEKYIVSPELVNLLRGNITGDQEIILDAKNPVFFILVRTNMNSKYTKRPEVKMSLFFD